MVDRRNFLKLTAFAATGLVLVRRTEGAAEAAPRSIPGPSRRGFRRAAPIPGGTLDPLAIPKFVTPMLIPPVMPRAGTIKQQGGKNADYYEISMRQISQQILPPADINGIRLDPTTVWGYGAVKSASKRGLLIHNAPSLTIEAKWNTPVRVKWINELRADPLDPTSPYLPHLLPVDPTLHWANPPQTADAMGMEGPDRRPAFESTPDPYTGPVPMVTHVHGAVGVADDSDGYAEAWYLPEAGGIPAEYATKGTWYDFFAAKAAAAYGVEWGPGYATFQYPNANRASTIWYHDHTLGMTRLNVYAGPAGFYLIRGGPAGDAAVIDAGTGLPAVLPGPAPNENDQFPPNKTYYEIPIAVQDRAFNADGSLFYPDTREFFDGATAEDPGYLPDPDTDLSPIWNPEFFGNCIMVNGNTWPFQTVEQRRYRFRFLNGCQSRFLILDFAAIPGVEVWQIGNEGGFLPAPVNVTALGNTLLMGLAERADVIVDFTNVLLGNWTLGNVGPDEPFKGFNPDGTLTDGEGGALPPADPDTTGKIMQFNVVPARAPDPTTLPANLVLPVVVPLPMETVTRPLALIEEMSMYWDGPAEALLGTAVAGVPLAIGWMDAVTENPAVGDTEVWEMYNMTGDAHPMHVHEVVFEVVNRQGLVLGENGEPVVPLQLSGDVRPPEPWEMGFKDTVIAYPAEVTRIRAQFNTPGQFVWHCHIVEHEDNEMMRPYRIGPEQPGQPMA